MFYIMALEIQYLFPSKGASDVNQKYMKMTKDVVLEGSSQQAKKDFVTKRNGQGPKHLNFFLLVFLK